MKLEFFQIAHGTSFHEVDRDDLDASEVDHALEDELACFEEWPGITGPVWVRVSYKDSSLWYQIDITNGEPILFMVPKAPPARLMASIVESWQFEEVETHRGKVPKLPREERLLWSSLEDKDAMAGGRLPREERKLLAALRRKVFRRAEREIR